ncbi:symplekin [Geosmithia morbida]|uniref:Symplekin n=1 Tax=Geosmithia morbida TaxID=1094350 RepID=A0A9P4YVX7_9HYPO|nr:symplekin [Geosmithia morbida]KAF4124086.1 symplekin [Geosmithia morbida]
MANSAAAAPTLSVPEQIRQLNDARKLVLGDIQYYPSVVRGIVPIIKPTASTELRRWGANFLAEAFATPLLPNGEKETMQPYVLELLESMINNEHEDPQVLRSVIQTAASIYPLALRWTINNAYDTITWERVKAIKQRIFHIWDTTVPSVRICCINDALIVDATLNCLSILARTRPATSSRILNALINFDPLRLVATSPLTPKAKITIRSMEKTARILLMHLGKRDHQNPLVPRIQQYIERTMRAVAEALDGSGKKRSLEGGQQQEAYDAKRQRIDPAQIQILPLGPGPHSLADVFSLADAGALKSFDLSQVPGPLVAKLAVNTLARIDTQLLSRAIEAVRDRLETLRNAPIPELDPNTAPLGVDEDDDDYEPDFFLAEDTEQILNKLDNDATAQPPPPGPTEGAIPSALDDALGLRAFSLPAPQPLTPELALSAGNGVVARVLGMSKTAEESRKEKAGFTRLAASSGSRESWMTILTRLATRSTTGLEGEKGTHKEGDNEEEDEQKSSSTINTPTTLSDSIRNVLYNYVMEDFRKHFDVAVSWLCEEWYNDKMQGEAGGDGSRHYEQWTLRLLDGFLPYLHPQDKVLTRFLSEIPELNRAILSRVKTMCKDPSVVQLALTSLLYLVIMRPPIKEATLDTVQDIWNEYEEARPIAAKYLAKYRPGFLEAAMTDGTGDDGTPATSTAIAT